MSNKFLNSGSSNLSDGTATIFAAILGATNLDSGLPVKVNASRNLVSEKLAIDDITNLQIELNKKIANPLIEDLDFQTYNAINKGYDDFNEVGVSPGSPLAGSVRLYGSTDGHLHSVDSAGNDYRLGHALITGDVVGPVGATDNAICRYDGTTGKLIQNSTATLDDLGNIECNTVSTNTTTIGAGITVERPNATVALGIELATNGIGTARWFMGSDQNNDNIVIAPATGERVFSVEQDGTTTFTHTNGLARYQFNSEDLLIQSTQTRPTLQFEKAGGTLASPLPVGSGAGPLGIIEARGYDGSGYNGGLTFNLETRGGVWTPTSQPTTFSIYSTDLGGTTYTEKLRIDYLGIGIGEGEGATTNGYLLPLTRGTTGQVLELGTDGNVAWTTPSTSSVTLQDAYDNSTTTPQITTSVANGAIELKQGIGAVNDLIVIEDSSGSTVGSISQDGFYTDYGIYIGVSPNSFNITANAGVFEMAEQGDSPFISYAPDNLNLNKTGLGNTTVRGGVFNVQALFQVNEVSTNGVPGVTNIYRKSRGTLDTPTVVLANDELTSVSYRGYDGTAYQDGCLMKTVCPSNWSLTSREAEFDFYTTPVDTITGPELVFKMSSTGQLVATNNKTESAPTYTFEDHPDSGMYSTGGSLGFSWGGSNIFQINNDEVVVRDGKKLTLSQNQTTTAVANPVVLSFVANGAYIAGLLMKVVDVGGQPRVEPVGALDPDSTGNIGVSITASAGAGSVIDVAIGGTFFASVINTLTVNIGDLCEKADTVGQDGRIGSAPASAGTVLVALGNATGNVDGSNKVLCMFKKNESF